MTLSVLAVVALSAVAAGGVAYVFLYPILSGGARAEKRQQALVVQRPTRRAEAGAQGSRRDQVAQSLKEIEQREKSRNRITLDNRIAQAGLTWTKRQYWLVSLVLGGILGFLLFMLSGEPMVGGLGLFVGVLGLPRWYLGMRKKKRINRYLEELPNAMDVIVRGLRSGLPLADCLRIIASEAQEPVKSEFRFLLEQQSIGISIADAVVKLYDRVPVPESNFFAIVINIQSKAGGNLSETLSNLSRVLRDRKKMKSKVQAMSQEAKASAAIIAALPFAVAILTYLSSPQYIELLWTTSIGKVALVVCAVWMSIGIAVMRKMINFNF